MPSTTCQYFVALKPIYKSWLRVFSLKMGTMSAQKAIHGSVTEKRELCRKERTRRGFSQKSGNLPSRHIDEQFYLLGPLIIYCLRAPWCTYVWTHETENHHLTAVRDRCFTRPHTPCDIEWSFHKKTGVIKVTFGSITFLDKNSV